MVDQWRGSPGHTGGAADSADDQGVITDRVEIVDGAGEPGGCIGEDGKLVDDAVGRGGEPVPGTGEARREVVLLVGEEMDGEPAGGEPGCGEPETDGAAAARRRASSTARSASARRPCASRMSDSASVQPSASERCPAASRSLIAVT